MRQQSISFTLSGRFILPDGDDLNYLLAVINLWRNLPPSLSERNYSHGDVTINVKVDWTSVIEQLEIDYKLSIAILSSSDLSPEGLIRPLEDTHATCCVTLLNNTKKKFHNTFFENILKCFLYDFFLILNLSLPGSVDFYNVGIRKKRTFEPLRLSSYFLQQMADEEAQWPSWKCIDISKVESWYRNIHPHLSQVAKNPSERAIFSLLHICQNDGVPEDMIWVFYGLESLLKTRVGENFSGLIERMSLLLSPNEKQETRMRKEIRSMYDFRSAFVHGGLPVIHPLHNEVMDTEVNNAYSKNIDLSISGVKFLVACLQKYAEENWESVNFSIALIPQIGANT